MLTQEENAFLTRVGPGTPMGNLLRQYWIPALQAAELDRDGRAVRIRLLGEDLVAYRDSSGRVGLLAERCPHRGASLYFGRNEDCGLRCVYHGWKFDATGACVDMPNEPEESDFKSKITHRAYPCEERGGIVWTYMGPAATPPPLPGFEWLTVPDDHRFVSKRYQECNWVQALEGGIDSSHISFLHTPLRMEDHGDWPEVVRSSIQWRMNDRHPHFEVVDTPYGLMIGARRNADAEHYYWRISHFLMPFYNMVPPGGDDPECPSKAWVPIDDESCVNWSIAWHPSRPLRPDEIEEHQTSMTAHYVEYLPEVAEPYGSIRPRANRGNDYEIDWERQRTRSFSGIHGVGMQDQAVQESEGIVYDRSTEHLGSSDLAVIQTRRRLVQAARALRDQAATPPGAANPDAYTIRGVGLLLPRDAAWVEGVSDSIVAVPGVNHVSI